MIRDPRRLQEVLEEIAEWPVERRRTLIAEIETAFGSAAAEQIRNGLTKLWNDRG